MNYAVYDIESNKWINFSLLGFFDGSDYKTFETVPKFLTYVFSGRKYNGWRFYAHNGGKFDIMFLLDPILSSNRYTVKIVQRQGRIVVLRVTCRGVTISFCDSYALLPDSLKRLCVAFHTEHQKTDIDVAKGFDKRKARDRSYLENDCIATYEVLQKFQSEIDIGDVQYTIASQALHVFKNQFLGNVELKKLKLDDEELIRDKFYAGGRVEMFKAQGSNLKLYDVNSLFPHAMIGEMPCGIPKRVSSYVKGQMGFYEVQITHTPDWYIPPYLVKGRKNFFVNGAGTYYLSSAMIDYLTLEWGVRMKVNYGLVFPRKEVLFRDYVERFYKMKSENKGTALYYIAKLFLNSLYGKLGQTRWRESVELWGKNLKEYAEFDNVFGLVLVLRESKSKFILPYLAAWITDQARLHHFRLMQEHERSTFYCDTDSVFTSARYPTGEKLGQLSCDGTYDGIFLGAKTYALKDEKTRKEYITFKGFDTEQFNYADFTRVLSGHGSLQQSKERMLSFLECLKRKNGIIRERGTFLKVVQQSKEALFVYDKRKLIDSSKFVYDTQAYTRDEVDGTPRRKSKRSKLNEFLND